MFMSCLHSAINKSSLYFNINLKPKQTKCLDALYNRRDTVAVLPTGYGKSLIYQLLPTLLNERNLYEQRRSGEGLSRSSAVILVFSPLNSLVEDHIRKINDRANLKATFLKTDISADFGEEPGIKDALFDILYLHPEACLSSKAGFNLFQSAPYQNSVQAIVVDEAHCILEWGDDFRTDYSNLGMICALFPTVPVLALTATASKKDRQVIKDALHMINPLEVVGSLNRPNIFYTKVFRSGPDIESYEEILTPIAKDLLAQKIEYPLTIVYLSLRWCGFAYRLFERILGPEQYFPAGVDPIPENRLFSQFHSPQTATMKQQILQELGRSSSKLRVVFATIAMGMGVDIHSIRKIIHIGPPRTLREYMQETGRAGRDGSSSQVLLFYNNRDIAKNRKGISEDIRAYCHLEHSCLREYLLNCLDTGLKTEEQLIGHLCCSNCSLVCH